MRTIEEVLNAEGLLDKDGNPVMSVKYAEFIVRWLGGRLKEEDVYMLAMLHGENLADKVGT